jgi:LysM repeat protein/ABC-type branched-subunit amino acid transport system substrate-binding protein
MGMKNQHLKYLVLIFFLSLGGMQGMYAQQDTSKVYEWNGMTFHYYKVEKGKTLYSISKTFQVSQDEILSMNPELTDGLKAGISIRIPVNRIPTEPEIPAKSYQLHKVKQQETAFGIAKMYGISIADLEKMNPEIKQGLKTGMELKVYPAPVKRPNIKAVNSDSSSAQQIITQIPEKENNSCNELSKKLQSRKIQISLLLPFYLPAGEELNPKARIGLDFYSGAKLALDSLKKEGFTISANVFDISNDSSSVDEILKNPSFAKSDLIIGPLYSSAFIRIAEYAKKKNIPAVSPFSQSDALLADKSNVIKVTPDVISQAQHCGPELKKLHPNAHFYLVRNNNEKDKEIADAIKTSLLVSGAIATESFHETTFSSVSDLLSMLSESNENIIIFPSTVQIQVIDFIARLSAGRLGKRITLVGLNDWNNYENIEFDHLNNLNYTFFNPSNSNFQSHAAQIFRARLKKEFKGEPSFYTFQGFDVTYFFAKQTAKYGDSMLKCLPQIPLMCGFNSCYRYDKIGENDGYENQFNYIIKMDDFELKRMNQP